MVPKTIMDSHTAHPEARQDGVVLLHGIFRTARSMRGLARFLERQGYRVLNLDYPSRHQPLEMLAEALHPRIETFTAELPGRVHFVGYSMGGLLIRIHLARHRPPNLGRVVMLAPPNGGSEIADFFQHWRLYRRLYGPAGQQLVTDQRTFAHLFGPAGQTIDYPVGILAGTRSLSFIGSRLLGAPGDGTVTIASTRLEGMHDHRTLPLSHTLFPISRRAWRETAYFLRQGSFS